MPLTDFHPAVSRWFERAFGEPTEPQRLAWPQIRAGRHTLIAAPTGSGKTLAAFLSAIDTLLREAVVSGLPDETRVVYVSPLKALSNDVQKNLEEPLAGVAAEASAMGLPPFEIRTQVRTGDTPMAERARMSKRPPHILVTTPESLYILLTSEGGRRTLRTARTVIVDEIHAVADDKRGAHLTLSLERLDALCGHRLQRIGLSATQRPVTRVAHFLIGADPERGGTDEGTDENAPDCAIVDVGHRRRLDLALELPRSPLEAVMSAEVFEEIYDRLAELIREHKTTLIFVNTRRLAERAARHLASRLGEDAVRSHHGSLSRERRLEAEQRLKAGDLRALVATASLELGIDIGSVDLVCQISTTPAIATLLQRVGRSGHQLRGLPKGRLFPLTRDELVEMAALLGAVQRGELEELVIPPQPLDILAQQMIATVAAQDLAEDDLYALVRRAWPYRNLERRTFDEVLTMVAQGFTTRRGRRGAYLHRDEVNRRVHARKGARLAAMTSGGAIPDQGDFRVILEPSGALVGTVNEDWAVESLPGDVFQLGNASWRIAKIEQGRVLVEDAHGAPPSIPFWLGEAPARSPELSHALAELRGMLAAQLAIGTGDAAHETPVADGNAAQRESGAVDVARRAQVAQGLAADLGLGPSAALQIVDYLAASLAALGALPDENTLVLERFFDEAGDQHLVLHAPFGSRVNRAWGLALRKRFCQTFNFELQAAATDDAVILSLGPTHSFPLADAFRFLHSSSVRHVLVQALLDAPMFGIRWRWNASRSLALLRWRSGRRIPPRLQRQEAEDLVAVVFPDQLACFENIQGEREVPDHPLVNETLRDCLTEAMDIDRLEAILRRLENGELELVARELTEPSPLAHEVIGAPPYAFLDDAPLEERRTQAVQARRFLSPEDAANLGALDREAIAQVRGDAWPRAETAEELHDALCQAAFFTAEEGRRSQWEPPFAELRRQRRATVLESAGVALWVAAERLPELFAVHPAAVLRPPIQAPASRATEVEPAAATVELLRGRLEVLGPVTASAMAADFGLGERALEAALLALETQGFVFRGRFTPGLAAAEPQEWCERRLLQRIHRLTLGRLRREIEPASKSDFLRFLLTWQRLHDSERARGPEGLQLVLEQLEGFSAPAAAWEGSLLPSRLVEYDPVWLDALCLSGRWAWGRPGPADSGGRRSGPVRGTPIALLRRESAEVWRRISTPSAGTPESSSAAAAVEELLSARGACFFDEIARGTRLLHTAVEEALAELVAWGRVTSDSFTGLRALLVPSERRRPLGSGQRKGSVAVFGMETAGRWSLLPPPSAEPLRDDELEIVAWTLLRRYGVVFRRLLDRESLLPPWRELVNVYRRLEDRGEVRGGRFVDGFSGEQYALPEAVARLRSLRKQPLHGDLVSVSAADPLNLVGIATVGERVTALNTNRVLYRDGEPLAILEAGVPRFLQTLDPAAAWQARSALVRRTVPPRLRAYLGRTA